MEKVDPVEDVSEFVSFQHVAIRLQKDPRVLLLKVPATVLQNESTNGASLSCHKQDAPAAGASKHGPPYAFKNYWLAYLQIAQVSSCPHLNEITGTCRSEGGGNRSERSLFGAHTQHAAIGDGCKQHQND